MLKRLLALAAAAVLLIGLGCTNGSVPTAPDKIGQGTPEEFFNSFDLSNAAVAEYTLCDFDGNLLSSGVLGRNDDGLYMIENRGAEIDINLSPLSLINTFVTYNNPAGTIETGPNAGLPYYYIGQTVDYDINLLSLVNFNINNAQLTAEMRYAAFDSNGKIIAGALLPGAPIFNWAGTINPGYQALNDTFQIVSGTIPGLDVTTVKIHSLIFFGIFDIIFFDGVAGVWDPQ